MFKPLKLQKSNARRPFQITIGLEEGYGTGIKHTALEVQNLIGLWITGRMERGEKSVSGVLIPAPLVYAWNTPTTGIKVATEDVVMFVGDVSPVYCAHYTDDDVRALLYDLAAFLGGKLKQTRMYVAYRDEIQVYEDDQAVYPKPN